MASACHHEKTFGASRSLKIRNSKRFDGVAQPHEMRTPFVGGQDKAC